MTVGFLTPCHSTPWRSHLVHAGINAWALTCDPPLHLAPRTQPRLTYLDEADVFYTNPRLWLSHNLGPPPKSHFLLGHAPPFNSSSFFSPPSSSSPSTSSSSSSSSSKEGRTKHWPEYLVFFGALERDLGPVLLGSRYEECWTGWNGWAHEDWRRRGAMRVWCLGMGMGRGRGR